MFHFIQLYFLQVLSHQNKIGHFFIIFQQLSILIMKMVNSQSVMVQGSLVQMLSTFKSKFQHKFGDTIYQLTALKKVILNFLGKILLIKITINYQQTQEILSIDLYSSYTLHIAEKFQLMIHNFGQKQIQISLKKYKKNISNIEIR